jgi:hypothetical protein
MEGGKMKKVEMVMEFFAVVQGGVVFRIFVERHLARLRRIAGQHGALLEKEVDMNPKGCRMAGITGDSGIAFFDSIEERNAENIPEDQYECQTLPVVALFLKMGKAMDCARNYGLEPWDSSWFPESKKTLRKIGDAHPHFSRSLSVVIRLAP